MLHVEMAKVASVVLTTVNAPYGANVSARELAALIADPNSATNFCAPAFSFFSEVSPALQLLFVEEMGIDVGKVRAVAREFSRLSGYTLAMAT